MTVQQYYEMQSELKSMEKLVLQGQLNQQALEQQFEAVRDAFNGINPANLIGGSAAPANTGIAPTTPPPVAPPYGGQLSSPPPGQLGGPVAVPAKPRKILNAPVIADGALKDVVEDRLREKAKKEESDAPARRIAPYEVVVQKVAIGPSNDYFATVYDSKNGESAYVEVPKGTYDEFVKDPDGLIIDLGPETLEKTEWFPAKEPKAAVEQTASVE